MTDKLKPCTCMGAPSCGDGNFEANLRRSCPVHGDAQPEAVTNAGDVPLWVFDSDDELIEELATLVREYGASNEPMTHDALQLKAKIIYACQPLTATAEADLANAKQSLDEAREVIEKLVEALDRAHDDMAAWQGYAGEYFLNKHGADDDLQAIKDALQSALTWLAATYPDSAFMEGK